MVVRPWHVLSVLVLVLGVSAVASASSEITAPRTGGKNACPPGTAQQAAEASLIPHAERYWGEVFGEAEFTVWRAICGNLAGRNGADMVVALGLVNGTGGSPKPWGIFNRTEQGNYLLRYENFGRKLICPSGMFIHKRKLDVYRPSEYLGGYTVCDQILTFRWSGSGYKRVKTRHAYRTCEPRTIRTRYGFTVGIRKLLVAGFSCGRGRNLIAKYPVGLPEDQWQCFTNEDFLTQCQRRNSWKKWMRFVANPNIHD